MFQVILKLIDFGMNVREAVSLPRVHHQWYPETLFIEPYGISPDSVALLRARGHRFETTTYMGNAQAIFVDQKTKFRYGASDPRGIGKALGY